MKCTVFTINPVNTYFSSMWHQSSKQPVTVLALKLRARLGSRCRVLHYSNLPLCRLIGMKPLPARLLPERERASTRTSFMLQATPEASFTIIQLTRVASTAGVRSCWEWERLPLRPKKVSELLLQRTRVSWDTRPWDSHKKTSSKFTPSYRDYFWEYIYLCPRPWPKTMSIAKVFVP